MKDRVIKIEQLGIDEHTVSSCNSPYLLQKWIEQIVILIDKSQLSIYTSDEMVSNGNKRPQWHFKNLKFQKSCKILERLARLRLNEISKVKEISLFGYRVVIYKKILK